jgi:hypothetical protein
VASQASPFWDGEVEILVRESSPDEVAVWERIRAKAVRDGDTDPDDENFLTYLRGVREIVVPIALPLTGTRRHPNS